jgi:hypothetical protein
VIPTPNDLLLQAAPGLPDPTKTALFSLAAGGGFVADPTTPGVGQLSVINVPFEFVSEGVGTTATVGIDPSTVSSATVAIVRVDVVPPVVFDPIVVGTPAGALQVLPVPGGYAGGRYVAAVRGGARGVKTTDGRSLSASAPIALIAARTNLGDPEGRPATLTDEQVADLTRLQGLLANPVDWVAVTDAGTCALAYNDGTPAAAFNLNVCWLPFAPPPGGVAGLPLPGVPAAADSQPVISALDAVELAFPLAEAVSIQAFDIQ